MSLDVQHLRMVKAIHEEGTLTRACRRLYLSQPALSRQLARLEARLGTTLFRRHHGGMELTREGQRLLDSAERVLGELERAEHDVKLLAQGQTGTVRVSTECYMCYHWLPGVVRAFGARCPDVEVQLVPEATRDPYGALERADVDVALVQSAPPAGAAVARVPLFEDEIVAAVSTAHRLAGEPWLAPGAFASETLLCHYAEPRTGVLEAGFLGAAGVRPRRTMELLVTPAVVEMARAGYGVAVMPRWIVDAQGSLDGLVALPLGEGGLWRTWFAASARARSREPVLARLTDALVAELAEPRRIAPQGVRIRLA